MKKTYDIEFDIGEIIYVIHDAEQLMCMVTGYTITQQLLYIVSCGASTNYFNEYELSREKQII